MFLIDDLLFSPVHGVAWIARKVLDAVEQDREAEEGNITTALGELYLLLETGAISEAEFDIREGHMLDRLDQLQAEEIAELEEGEDVL